MIKKLGMTVKQKLTTLAILGTVAGMGLQVDTAQAATADQSTGERTTSGQSANETANDPTSPKAVISNDSKTVGTDNQNSQDQSVKPMESTTPKESVQAPVEVPKDSTTKPSEANQDESDKASQMTNLASAGSSQDVADQTTHNGSNQMNKVSRASLLRDDAPATIKASGTSGTAHWAEDTDGVVTITGGNLARMKVLQDATKLIFDGSLGKIVLPVNSSDLFRAWINITEIDGWENVDASNVTDMHGMFDAAVSLKSLDLSALDLSHVTDMTSIASGLYTYSDRNGVHGRQMSITGFKLGSSTSHVTKMSSMLTYDSSLTDVDAADWNVSSLQDADSLFYGTAINNLDLSKWQAPNLQSLSGAFGSMANLKTIDVSNLQTGNVTNFGYAFTDDPLVTTIDISKWDVSNSQNFAYMFSGDSALSTVDLSRFNTIAPDNDYDSVNDMLLNTTGLHKIVLGPNLSLGDVYVYENAGLPDIPVTDTYTGLWQAVGTGTVDQPKGATYTSEQLNTNYDGATMADTYVWQRVQKATIPTNPGTTTPTDPGTTTPTDPDTNTNGGGTTIVNPGKQQLTPSKETNKPIKKQVAEKSKPTTVTNGGKPTVLSADQGATVTKKNIQNRAMTKHVQQNQAQHAKRTTTLPQTNEQKSSTWAAIGAVMLGILGFYWYKRQD